MSIKIIYVLDQKRNIDWGGKLDFPTRVMETLDQEAKRDGFVLEISYMSLNESDQKRMAEECMRENVAGVILMGTELEPKDRGFFSQITKPMIVYDTDFQDGRHHCVVPDNRCGVRMAFDYLYQQGIQNIVYLKAKTDAYYYNLSERFKAVQEIMLEKNQNPFLGEQIVELGPPGEDVYRGMLKYISEKKLPEAFVSENCSITLGILRAFRERNIKIPEDISLVAIDEIPEFYSDGINLTAIKIPHEERAVMAMQLLKMEMISEIAIKSKVLTGCKLVKGNSVKKRIYN